MRDHEALRLLLAGASIGVLAGLIAGGFDWGMVAISKAVLGTGEPSVEAPALWRALLGPVVLGVGGGLIIRFATRRRRPQGVPDVIARVRGEDHPLSLRDAVASGAAAMLTVGGGQSGGREGPIIQLAATGAARICGWLGLRPVRVRPLVAAGAAAGIAASFNSPLGGAFFALEIILGNFALETFAPVVAATVMGTVVGQAVLGDRIAVHLPPFVLRNPFELLLYMALGAVCAVVARVFTGSVTRAGRWMSALPIPAPARTGLAGLGVGTLAASGLYPLMGNGYPYMEALIGGRVEHGTAFLVALLVAKIAATAITAGGRSGAGLFAPSLFLGAVTGTIFGLGAQSLWPGHVEAAGAYGMVGMGAVVAAVMQAPITMTLMLFEMTGNYAVILPLLLSLATAGAVSLALRGRSIYDLELAHLGLDVAPDRERLVLYRLHVADVMRTRDFERVEDTAPAAAVVRRFVERPIDQVYVVDSTGRLVRTVDIHDVKHLLAGGGESSTTARGIQARDVPSLRPSMLLGDVLPSFFDACVEQLPVVDAAGVLIGVLVERDVVAAHHREALRTDARLARIDHVEEGRPGTDFLELPPGQVIEVIDVGATRAGQNLRELQLPQRHACTVIAMSVWDEGTRRHERCVVDPDRILTAEDRLVVLGSSVAIAALG